MAADTCRQETKGQGKEAEPHFAAPQGRGRKQRQGGQNSDCCSYKIKGMEGPPHLRIGRTKLQFARASTVSTPRSCTHTRLQPIRWRTLRSDRSPPRVCGVKTCVSVMTARLGYTVYDAYPQALAPQAPSHPLSLFGLGLSLLSHSCCSHARAHRDPGGLRKKS